MLEIDLYTRATTIVCMWVDALQVIKFSSIYNGIRDSHVFIGRCVTETGFGVGAKSMATAGIEGTVGGVRSDVAATIISRCFLQVEES